LNKTTLGATLLVAVSLAACGGSSPVTPTPSPTPVATPTPAPTPTPTPVPTPTPCTQGLCEEPVTNTNPPVRLTLRLYTVESPSGGFTAQPDPGTPITVGHIARLDVTAKDVDNRETIGRGDVEFFYSNPVLVRVFGNHTHQRRLEVLRPGQLDIWATQDGVRSNVLTLTFQNP
jgi:hypothetical protein